MLEDLTGLTQLHAEAHARGMSSQEGDTDQAAHSKSNAAANLASDNDNASIPDIDDDWTSL